MTVASLLVPYLYSVVQFLAHGLLASQTLDLRLNQVSVETVAAIEGICKKNKLDAQRARRELFEAQRLAEKQPI